ncbi:hypothetical protein LIER_33840 [Lithospermum erythrorhizon]|uniref:Uncharacterized protein n=1 Tax=Lithospermum erythrorhizon TaxID=34254 RepID=A0AAV3S1V1_LITER
MLRHKNTSKRDGDESDLATDKVDGKSKDADAMKATRFQQETSNVVKHHTVEERFKDPLAKMYLRNKKRIPESLGKENIEEDEAKKGNDAQGTEKTVVVTPPTKKGRVKHGA